MKCRECAEARKFADGAVFCVIYGMIISAEHECDRKGGRLRGAEDRETEETGLLEDGGGAVIEMPGILSGSGERAGFSGMEE